MLRLVGELDLVTCPTCRGRGRIPCPATITVRTQGWGDAGYAPFTTPSTGKPIPCPECLGKQLVPATSSRSADAGLDTPDRHS